MIQTNQQKIVDEAITSRHSMRAFLPTPVSREDVASMLEVAARGRGLDTCAQAAFNRFHPVIRRVTGISEQEIVMCGLALGVADLSKIENTLISEREPLTGFTQFLD